MMSELSIHEDRFQAAENCTLELTQIRGIGLTRRKWLRAIAIHTLSDLAQTSVSELESQLRNTRHPVSRHEIERWVSQARMLLGESASVEMEATSANSQTCYGCQQAAATLLAAEEAYRALEAAEAVEEAMQKPETAFQQEDDRGVPQTTAEGGSAHLNAQIQNSESDKQITAWRSLASFSLEIQTRQVDGKTEQRAIVRHLQTNAVGTWRGSDLLQLPMLDWIRTRSPINSETETVRSVTPASVVITQVRSRTCAGQQMETDRTSRLFPSGFRAGEPFALEICLEFAGEGLEQQPLICRTQCDARHLFTGETIRLGDALTKVTIDNKRCYTAILSDLALPAGVYRLQFLVTLQNFPATPACFKIPMLQIG
jgi:hypothetical protein